MNVTKLYADDTKLLSEMVTEESALNLQRDLDFAFNWTQDWLIKFNINKSTIGIKMKKDIFSLMVFSFMSLTRKGISVLFSLQI